MTADRNEPAAAGRTRRGAEAATVDRPVTGRPATRRAVLALAGLSPIGGCLGLGFRDDDGESEAEPNAAPTLPIDIRTVDAPGSEAGTYTVPRDRGVTFLNFTRLLCPTSEGLIETIGDVRADLDSRYDVGPGADLRFVSVINPGSGPDPTDAELAEWWDEHGGEWPIGVDEGGALNEYYEVSGFPTVAALDGDGEAHWRDTGGTSSNNMIAGAERALAADPAVDDPPSESDETASDSET